VMFCSNAFIADVGLLLVESDDDCGTIGATCKSNCRSCVGDVAAGAQSRNRRTLVTNHERSSSNSLAMEAAVRIASVKVRSHRWQLLRCQSRG